MKPKNPRNAGLKPKYKVGTVTKKIHPKIPIEVESEVLEAINEVVKPYLSKS